MVNGESTSTSYSDNNGGNDQGGDFECNICFEIAQDPIVTLCGHLFCWPCLYRWLHHHSHSQECPVCKALVEDDKLVPLYGRGKNHTDPRTKRYSGIKIPNRPTGQRPETASPLPPQAEVWNNFFDYSFGLMGGFMPMATTRIGNFSMGVGGLLPSLLNFQFHGFPDARLYGSRTGYPYGGYNNGFRHEQARNYQPQMARGGHHQRDAAKLFLFFGILVIILLCW